MPPEAESDLLDEVQQLRERNEYLEAELEYLKTRCLSSSGRGTERQKAEIVSELRHRFPLRGLLKLSGLARSTYYYYLKQQGTDKYQAVKQEIESIFTENKQRYGYRRVLLALRQKAL